MEETGPAPGALRVGTAGAVCIIQAALAIHLTLLGAFFMVFLPLPLLFYRARLGRKGGAAVLGLTLAAAAGMLGKVPAEVGLYYLALPVLGFLMQEAFEWNPPATQAVGVPVLLTLVGYAAMVAVLSTVRGAGPMALAESHMGRMFDQLVAGFAQAGMEAPQIEALKNMRADLVHYAARMLPSWLAASMLAVAWVNLLAALPILRMNRLWAPDFGPLNRWSPPERLVWVAIGGGMAMLLPHHGARLLGANVLIVLFVVYCLAGMAILSYTMEKKEVPRGIRTLVYILVVWQQVLLLAVAALGFFDLWADFRKINKRAPQQ